MILAIDPAYAKPSGWAVVDGRQLVACGASPVDDLANAVLRCDCSIDVVVVEIPYPRPGRKERASAEVLSRLSFHGGVAAGLVQASFGCEIRSVFPHQWKGGTPKAISHARIRGLLTDNECRILAAVPRREAGDVLDAIGIGFWAVGRR